VVVRHFRNRDAEVLFPNGTTATFNKKDMMWIVINNKGRRTGYKNDIRWDLDPIPCATETDAVTNATMMIREDKVLTIKFKDGSLYCQHSDGSLMLTSADEKTIRIEKEGFAPVVIHLCEEISPNAYTHRSVYDTKERTLGGYYMETFLPDGTIVETFKDFLENNTRGIRHVYKRSDFTVISVSSLGQIAVISSNARSALNEAFGKRLIGHDQDYCMGMYL
jgi:hypothetical protein